MNARSELSITKTGPLIANPTDTIQYVLTVTNTGPNDSNPTIVTDELPPNVSFQFAASAVAGCTFNAGPRTVVCNFGNLASGATEGVSIFVTIGFAAASSVLHNVATVDGPNEDTNPDDDRDEWDTVVPPAADLEITKTADEPVRVPGENVVYTLTVTNHGPTPTPTTTVTDTLPAGFSLVSATASPAGSSCSNSGTPVTVVCQLGGMGNGATATIRIEATVGPPDKRVAVNTARVSSPIFDQNPDNNVDTAQTQIPPLADLSITKTDSPDPVRPGELLTYTLTVRNDGPSNAPDVTVTDNLPASLGPPISAISTQGNCATTLNSVNCTIGQINNGAGPVTITITARVADNTTGNIVNTARVDLDETQVPDPDHDNNEAMATTAVTPTADLSITKTDNPDPVQAGHNVTYTLVVENHGPSTATDVEVTDDLPPSLTLVSASLPPGAGNCNNTDPVECNLGTIPNGGSKTVTIVATVAPSAAGTQISNTATVDGAEDDIGPRPNSDTELTDVIPEADLEITKSDDVDPVRAGAELTYTLTVRNAGANTATGIVVTDDLPDNVDFISATPSQGNNCTGTDPVTCNLGALANQAVATIQIKVKVDPGTEGTQLTNTATVAGTLDDPDLDNNQATEPTDVLPEADVSVVKRAEPGPYLAGGLVTYVLTIANDGPNPAEEVKLTDDLPASLTLVSASPGQGSCVDADPLVCGLVTLGSGDSTEVRVVARIGDDRSAEQIVNTAAVESMTFDPDLGDNEDDATISVEPDADLSVVKTTSAATAVSGDNITWTITVHNNGPDPSTQTELTDDLPAELTLVSASPSQGTCNSADPLVCQLGTIPVGGTVTVEVVTQINELAGDTTISNSAFVKSAEHDPSMPNNSNAAVLSTSAKPQQPERKVHFSLRFRYVDKHGESFVVARVYCHSPGCDLSGTGRIRILPYDREGGTRTKLTTFRLGSANQSYPYTRGRQSAGTLSFPVKAIDARRVQAALDAGARGKVRADITVRGSNSIFPEASLERFRNIKLFAVLQGTGG